MEDWNQYLKTLVPLPEYVRGLKEPVRRLGTEWLAPPEGIGCGEGLSDTGAIGTGEVDRRDASESRGETKETVYTGRLEVPEEFAGYHVFLRFERAGCIAALYADGILLQEHYGTYTAWEAELPQTTREKKEFEIRLVLKGDCGKLSPYQKAGIFGDCSLAALPDVYFAGLTADPAEDGAKLTWRISGDRKRPVQMKASAVSQDGTEAGTVCLSETDADKPCETWLSCQDAVCWSPENPVLYRLSAEIYDAAGLLMKTVMKIGFRSLQISGNQLLWNRTPVKLKGICYREPLLQEGFAIRKDLELFKQAGVNYIRALYYPFDEKMLALCDEMGFFTEQMPAVSEVDQGIAPTQNAPEYRKNYLAQFGEVLEAGRSHVSVLLWLLGSECTWGDNFRQEYRLAKYADPVRPVNFHYPMTVPEEETQPDVWSVSYASWNLKLDEHYDHMTIGHTHGSHNEIGYATGQAPDYEMPVLHDAFAHIACFNRDEIERDPGIREFWGESIVRFVKKMEHTKGTLGGAVMAAVDEDGRFDARLAGYHYGILDETHQPKPEYYHLAMAYTGGATYEADPQAEAEEVRREKLLALNAGEEVCRGDTEAGVRETAKDRAASPYRIEETKEEIRFVNNRFCFRFSKKTCLLSGVWAGGELIIKEGPYPQTTRFLLPEWKGDKLLTDVTPDGGCALIEGHFGTDLKARFELKFTAGGKLTTEFTPITIGRPMPHTVKANIGVDPGGLDELGIAYLLPERFDRLKFKRRGLWKEYPDTHIGRCEGTAFRENRDDFESMKHSVIYAKAQDEAGAGVLVLSDGSVSVRMQGEPAEDLVIDDRDDRIVYRGTWYQMDDYCGNYKGTESLSKTAGDEMEYTFEGTGIAVYGPTDINYGLCSILIDGKTVKENISRYPDAVDFPAMSRGYEKRYRLPFFRITGLGNGNHTLTLKVLGKKVPGAQETYVSVDYLVVEKPGTEGNVRMIINNDFNYTRLVRGNYMRDRVVMKEGCTVRNTVCLCAGGFAAADGPEGR